MHMVVYNEATRYKFINENRDTSVGGGRITLFEVGTFKYRLQRNRDDWVTS